MDTTGNSTGGNFQVCFGCMSPLSGAERFCPVCGYDRQAVQSAMFLQPGTYLARRYLLGKALGYDKYFVTYLALDTVSNQRVEVKEYFPSEYAARLSEGRVNVYAGAAGESFLNGLRLFWEEESSPKRAELQGIQRVLDLFQANQTAYAVLEWMDGRTLHEYLEAKRMLPVSEATDILKQVLASLCSLHRAGFMYRELLPENILLFEGGEIKLRDFSSVPSKFWISPAEDPLWNAGCAPLEFSSVDFTWGEQSDIYVVGALFYEMITGHPPLDARTRQRGGILPLPSNLGIPIMPPVENVLEKSLALTSAERYSKADEVLAALEKPQRKKV
ncbi:MAG: protein kinase, partial [Blautia sp.]|nr:protein kinase [Blautia sp.]